MSVTFVEFTNSLSPGNAGFSIEGGRATLQLDVAAAELQLAIVELLGDCRANGDGRLMRVLPKAHPTFPWLFCERISNIQGLSPDSQEVSNEDLEAPALEYFQGYLRYRFTCEFTPRPYRVLADGRIEVETPTVYGDDDSSASPSSTTPVCATEWARFTDIITDPKPELITAQHGQMVFYSTVAPANGPTNAETFSGFPRIYMPNGEVRVRWYQVPESYTYSSNSHLRKWAGRVNQRTFLRWAPGELLYKGYTQKRYTPPVPEFIEDDQVGIFFMSEKLVDLELIFDETRRTIGSAYTPDNRNHVAGGHNLQPYLKTRKFHYAAVKSETTAALRIPTHLSFEARLLFTDPDI